LVYIYKDGDIWRLANKYATGWENGIQLLGSYTTKRVTRKKNDTATPVGFREVGNCGTKCIAQDVSGRSEAEESSLRKMKRNNGLVLLNV